MVNLTASLVVWVAGSKVAIIVGFDVGTGCRCRKCSQTVPARKHPLTRIPARICWRIVDWTIGFNLPQDGAKLAANNWQDYLFSESLELAEQSMIPLEG